MAKRWVRTKQNTVVQFREIDSAAVGGICSREERCGNEDVECYRVWISRELEATMWAESVAEVWKKRERRGRAL
jgi:hypothetical protein